MSETVSERPYERPYARLIWPEAVSIASLVLNVVVVVILIVAFVGRHHGGFRGHGPGQGHEEFQHGGPGFGERFGGPGRFEGGPGRFGGEEHGGFGGGGHGWGGDGKFEGRDGGPGHEGGPGHDGAAIDPQEMANHHLDRLSEQYSLTDAQKNQLKPILVQAATDAQKNMEDAQKARTAARDAIRAKIRAVLTPDQQKQFDQESQDKERPQAP